MNAPLSFFEWGDEPALRCPFCDGEYTHIEQVTVTVSSGKGVEVHAYGEDRGSSIKIAPMDAESVERAHGDGRRMVIALRVSCEHCSGGKIILTQHKGMTLTRLQARTEEGCDHNWVQVASTPVWGDEYECSKCGDLSP